MTFFIKKCPFSRPKFMMTIFSHRTWFSDFSYLFSRFSISLLPVMSYMTLSSQEKPLFQKIIPWWHLFLLYSCFRTHPTNTRPSYFSKYWRDGCMGRPHLYFWGDRLSPSPPVPPRSPPVPLPLRVWTKSSLCSSCSQLNQAKPAVPSR